MKKVIVILILIAAMMCISVAVCASQTVIPTEVPPCPEEYKGGLVP